MALPSVKISLSNGNLGQTAATRDGIAGLILSGIAVASTLALATPYQVFNLKQAEALGLNAAYDTTNGTDAYKHVKDFYAAAGDGAELWLMVVANTVTLAQAADKDMAFANTLLQAAGGRVRLLGITRSPAGSYVVTRSGGLDSDVAAALPKAQALAAKYEALQQPVAIWLEGRDYSGTVADLTDLKASAYNSVSVLLASDKSTGKGAFVGFALGYEAALPVQRKISRVKNGDLGIVNAYLSNGATVSGLSRSEIEAIHDKGYVLVMRHSGKNGYFFTGDPTATSATDDYNSRARRRTINKAIELAYATYLEELDDDIEIDELTGQMEAGVIKGFQASIESAIIASMVAPGELSGVEVLIDPLQNVLSTNTVEIALALTPKGYAQQINVLLGFKNPAL